MQWWRCPSLHLHTCHAQCGKREVGGDFYANIWWFVTPARCSNHCFESRTKHYRYFDKWEGRRKHVPGPACFLLSGIQQNRLDCRVNTLYEQVGSDSSHNVLAELLLLVFFVSLEIFVKMHWRVAVWRSKLTAAHTGSLRSKIAFQMQNSDGQNIASITAGCWVHKPHHFHQPATVELDDVHYSGWWS